MHNNKGMVMVMVVAFIFLLLILSGALMMIAASHFGSSYRQVKRNKAYYAAEAGKQYALWKCRVGLPAGYDLTATPPPISDDMSEVLDSDTIEGIDGSDIDITVYALSGHLTGVHRIDVTVDY